MLIKLLLLALVALLAVWILRNRQGATVRAGGRVLVVLGFGFAVAAILFPDVTQWAAELLGVTRGADLLFYAVTITVTFLAVGAWLRFRELERRLAAVARAAALNGATISRAPQHPIETPSTREGTATGDLRP